MKLIYCYNRNCGACKDYMDVVDKLSKALDITLEKQDIDEIRPSYKIEGIPTVILERNGVELYRSVGNVPFQQLYKDVKDYV